MNEKQDYKTKVPGAQVKSASGDLFVFWGENGSIFLSCYSY